jgi:isopentenyl-diphosphate delta-isomerase
MEKIETVCRQLSVPVIAKEVGWGISAQTARMLASAGVTAIDVAGSGGTSWSQVEMHRLKDKNLAKVAAAFRDWGIPTAQSLIQVRQAVPDTLLFASGGLRDGIDIAKCIALGATLGGMAGPFLRAAAQSANAILDLIDQLKREIRIAMFASGAGSLLQLKQTPLVEDTNHAKD